MNHVMPILLAVAFAASAGHSSVAAVDEGRAAVVPWSGYWWPLSQGGLTRPLAQYDAATGRAAAEWERRHIDELPSVEHWFGYCHAWSAAAVTELQPASAQSVDRQTGSPLSLSVGDLKGMLCSLHANDIAATYGDRYGDGVGSEDQSDLPPDELWQLLRLYVQDQEMPLIVDLEPGPEVWNFPVYAYQVEYTPVGDTDRCRARMTLWLADDAVHPDYVGTQVRRQVYAFEFVMQDGAVQCGSGRWTGLSEQDHPDFAWYPLVTACENPELHAELVDQLINGSREPSPAETTATSDNPQPTETASVGDAEAATEHHQAAAISPHELAALLVGRTSSFGLDVFVDRFDGGEYRVGDPVRVSVVSEEPGYLYLLQIDSTGDLSVLYPQSGDDNRIAADQSLLLPAANAPYRFEATKPIGIDRIRAVVTERPLSLTGLLRPHVDGKGDPTGAPRRFRWHPTQRRQIQQLLTPARQQQTQQLTEQFDLPALIGRFAQDETVFYVGKRNDQGVSPQQRPTPNPPMPREDEKPRKTKPPLGSAGCD